MKLVYIAYGNVSVFDSQVVALLNYYIEIDQVKEVILLLGIDYKRNSKAPQSKIDDRIEIKYYKQFPQHLLIEQLTILSITKSLKEIKELEKYIIHVRNEVLAYYVYKSFNKLNICTDKIIADVRGAGYEQLSEYSNKSNIIIKFKKFQRKQVEKSLIKIHNISVVSESLRKYITNKIGRNTNIRINSCLANRSFVFSENERETIRKNLNIKNNENLIVLSTGGNNIWQNTEDTIRSLTKKDVKVLNLSRSIIKHEKVINRFIVYEEMFKYLCAADVAIIWRNNSITNKVASPVKFSEYIACGLPVITNDSIDLITEYISLSKYGKIVNNLDSLNDFKFEEFKKLDRYKISLKGRKDFGLETIANQYLLFYQSINKK